jgi:hypothetical protein
MKDVDNVKKKRDLEASINFHSFMIDTFQAERSYHKDLETANIWTGNLVYFDGHIEKLFTHELKSKTKLRSD